MLMELLSDWRCRLQYVSDSIRTADHKDMNVDRKDTIFHTSQKPSPQDTTRKHPGCWLHKSKGETGEHPIWRCRDFQNRPIGERLQLVILHNACHVCLLQNCPGASQAGQCQTKFTCMINGCGKRHNQLLHVDPQPANAGGNPSTPALLLQSL